MARDEHRMPLPSRNSPLPWQGFDGFEVADANSDLVAEDFSTESDASFVVHAANNIIPAREIVRRLIEWHCGPIDKHVSLCDIVSDAEKLWAKMQSEVRDGS